MKVKRRMTSLPNHRLLKGGAWSVFGGGLQRFSFVVISVLLARILGAEKFGVLSIVYLASVNLGMFGSYGIAVAAIRVIAKSTDGEMARVADILSDILRIARVVALLSCAVMVIVLLLMGVVGEFEAQEKFWILMIAFGLLYFSFRNAILQAIIVGFELFRKSAILSGISGAITILLVVAGASLGGVAGALAGYFLSAAILFVAYRKVVKDQIGTKNRRDIPPFGSSKDWLLPIAMPASIYALFGAPAHWFCLAILQGASGPREVGLLTAAYQWHLAILLIPGIFGTVMVPILTRTLMSDGYAGSQATFRTTLLVSASLSVSFCLIAVIGSGAIMGLYGAEFKAARWVLILLSIASVPTALSIVFYQRLTAEGRLWDTAKLSGVFTFLYVSLTILFVAVIDLGAHGVAVAFLISQFILLLLHWYFSKRHLNFGATITQ